MTRARDLAGLAFPWIVFVVVTAAIAADLLLGPGTTGAMHAHHAGHGPDGGASLTGLPAPLYYGSVALVLLLSFGVLEWRSERQKAAREQQARVDLLSRAPLRKIVGHPVTRLVGQAIVVGLFFLTLAAGLFGTQVSTRNIAPLLTWTIWWCGLIVIVLFAGKAWCFVCPWDAVAGWAEGKRPLGGRGANRSLGLRWPRALRNIWPATILFIGLTWLELGLGVTMSPRATAYLGMGMLGFAFASAFVFDRKSFCRYGCLVGRISGLYALFSPVEVRVKDRDVCRGCTTQSCYRGNDLGDGCPTFEYPATLAQNTYCISCMECVRTCEAENVTLNLRPWGADLAEHRKPRSDEAYLALILLSLTGFHGLTMTSAWGDVVDGVKAAAGLGETLAFSLGMLAILLGPVVLYAALVGVARWAGGQSAASYREHFLRYAYALLPIALFYHLAHNSEHLLSEGGRLLALVSDPFGREWDLFGTAGASAGSGVSLGTLWGIQVALIVIGHVYGLWASRRAAEQLYAERVDARRSQLPMLVAMILFSSMSLWLLRQPMEMRLSWM